ncbi:uncharacterized protein LOC105700187 isoform X2 [Orussus abietinus]|uniref:uncharacterized protein LOC105700187 isoform X2 n=1 Tax=Orussus abietinus TaxID=222816 RepID=UPI000C716332|nr:uncharacterized protein LOC105700187 isoform X2 [Orussus abietinus]
MPILRDVANLLQRIGGRSKENYKMASSGADDGDLIDLGSGACVPRATVSQASPEEQEHLLDVCPPKLEQKLSLTRKQELVREINDDGDVLVTLGHDRVVPVRKRIDVVSTDTIKRIRDITRNLEPVIHRRSSLDGEDFQDSADGLDGSLSRSRTDPEEEEETVEAQEINDAFNFLMEVDDLEEREDRLKPDDLVERNRLNATSATGSLMGDGRTSYPLEPTCFIRNHHERSRTLEVANRLDSNERTQISPLDHVETEFHDLELDKGSVIPRSSIGRNGPWSEEEETFEAQEINNAFNFLMELDDLEEREDLDERNRLNETSAMGSLMGDGRTSYPLELTCFIQNHHERSRTLEVANRLDANERTQISPLDHVETEFHDLELGSRSTIPRSSIGRIRPWSVHIDMGYSNVHKCHSLRSTEEGRKESVDNRSFSARQRLDRKSWSKGVKLRPGRGGGGFDRSISVDADYRSEPSTSDGASHRRQVSSIGLADESSDYSSSGSSVDWSWLEEVAASPTTRSGTCAARVRADVAGGRDSKGSVAMSVAGEGKSSGPREGQSSGARPASAADSWVRASMRRLRHLRLPDFEAAGRATSAPDSLPDIALVAPDVLAAQTNGTSVGLRPASAPAPLRAGPPASPRRGRSRAPTAADATCSVDSAYFTGSSPASSPACSPASSAVSSQQDANRRVCERQRDAERDDDVGEDDDEDGNPLGKWPHALSPALACLGCTLGLFNISRFSILSIQFGVNFIVQFLILSFVLGIPLLTLQVCLGQRLAAGAVDMWKISPLFQGVGIALLIAQAFIGIYSVVGVSWMFVYFRDSFITKQDRYRWAEPFLLYREDTKPTYNSTSYKLHETVPDYFSGAVLQRHHLNEPDPGVVTLKFQVAFNLAVVWMIVFVSLSKGLRSYGKVVYVFTLVPVFGTLILCTKLLGLTPAGSIHQLFPATVWNEFFVNGRSWLAASSEVFLTWGLLGAAAMQIAAHNKHKHLLQRDTSLVVVLTLVVLLLAAFLANTCVQILRHHGYVYTTSSFERISGYTFMRRVSQPVPPGYNTPERFVSHTSFIVGQRVIRPGSDLGMESGYQVLRLSTELLPATLALLGTEQVSPFWAVLFYFILILFGIAQQLAIWHCVITGIMAINTKMMKLWETTITFFSCACAYILGLPMATELGIYVVYYLDYTIGGSWWIMVLYVVQVGAVFAFRGRPFTGDEVVAELFPPTGGCLRHWAGPLLSFTWNVIAPVLLMILSITVFKSAGFRELYTYRRTNRDYWAVWARQLGAAIQLIPILVIPAVGIIQTCRYLNSGPPDIFDRIQLLYRPFLESTDPRDAQTQSPGDTTTNINGNGILPSTTDVPFEDPPPKYTPPPSYTTATGARIAKMLRQSFRRSVRRIANVLGETSAPRTRPALQPPPPDYATVLVEMTQGVPSRDSSMINPEPRPDVTDTRNVRADVAGRHRPNTIDRMSRISIIDRSAMERTHATLDRNRRPYTNSGSSNLTAADVANLLRSSIRRGTARTQQTLRRSFGHDESTTAASVENLVEAAAPIGQDSLVFPKDVSLVPGQDDKDDKKTVEEMDNSVSVI